MDAQMPVRAKRVVYFEDPFLKGIHAAQEGELPFLKGPVPPMGELPLSVRAMPTAPRGSGLSERDFEARMGLTEPGRNAPIDPSPRTAARSVRAAAIDDDRRQMEMDFSGPSDLSRSDPSGEDVAHLEKALKDLEQLAGDIARSPETDAEQTEKLVSS